MPEKRNKVRVTAFVSPYIKNKIRDLVNAGEFGSESDLIVTALTEWLAQREMRTTYKKERIKGVRYKRAYIICMCMKKGIHIYRGDGINDIIIVGSRGRSGRVCYRGIMNGRGARWESKQKKYLGLWMSFLETQCRRIGQKAPQSGILPLHKFQYPVFASTNPTSASVKPVIAQVNEEPNIIRRSILEKIEKNTGRPVITYIAEINHPAGNIIRDDYELFYEALRVLNFPKKLDLIIRSPGGLVDATAHIINLIRNNVKRFRVIVPEAAKSAATLIALSSDEILMGPTSELGPIDPQIQVGNDPQTGQPVFRPAQSYLNAVENLEGDLREGRNPNIVFALLGRIDPTMLDVAKNAIGYSQSIAENCLKQYMFREDHKKAEKIAEYFCDANKHLSHGRPIYYKEARDMGLKIKYIGPSSELWSLIYEYFIRSKRILGTNNIVKVVETPNHTFFQQAQLVRLGH